MHVLTEIQLEIAAAQAASRVGTRTRILVDARTDSESDCLSPLAPGAVAVGRSAGEALDIDGVVYLEADSAAGDDLEPGDFVDALITAADVHDLRARRAGRMKHGATA
jgi:ribosomal protein S12 methylthiotransferase